MPSQTLETTIKIARDAGELLREGFRRTNQVHFKEDSSLVSESDLISHEFIIGELTKAFPNHAILSEESPGALQTAIEKDRPTWIIDPLDGTSNFLAGIPLFTVAIALVEAGETHIGIIYDPIHDELFVAEKGQGATRNGIPLMVSKKNTPRGAMLFAGRGYKEQTRIRHAHIISELEKQTPYFRRLGCATIMLASVAAGRADATILTGSSSWDMVAGALLIQEAGGKITDYQGRPWTYASADLVATNGILHDAIITITRAIEETTSESVILSEKMASL